MRARTRTTPGKGARTAKAYDQSLPDSSAFTTVAVPPDPPVEYHFIVDSPQYKHIFNDVYHVDETISKGGYFPDFNENEEYAWWWKNTQTPDEGAWLNYPTSTLLPSAFALFPEFRGPLPIAWLCQSVGYPEWAREKWKGPKLTLASGFSLINFLFEWRESATMIKSWLSRQNWKDRYHAVFGKNERLPDKIRAIANERLAHVYGTDLFIRDAYTLFKLIITWKDRANKFLSEAGSIRKSYKKPLKIEPRNYVLGPRPFPVFLAEQSSLRCRLRFEGEFHAVLAYSYSCPEIQTFLSRLIQLCDIFGVKPDAGILWDAIPLSFVVDWFINVSEYLHSHVSTDWRHAELKLLEFCHSANLKITRELVWSRAVSPGVIEDLTLATSVVRYYRRQRDDPPVFTKAELELQGQPWKIGRIINAAALGIQAAKPSQKARTKKYSLVVGRRGLRVRVPFPQAQ